MIILLGVSFSPKEDIYIHAMSASDAFNFCVIESDYKSNLFNVNRNPVRLQPFHLSHSAN